MTTETTLQQLVDSMIDQAADREPAASYILLTGPHPVLGADWISTLRVYRFTPIGQTRLVPAHLAVLAPHPDNTRHGMMREFHADLTTGQIAEHPATPQPGAPDPLPASPHPAGA